MGCSDPTRDAFLWPLLEQLSHSTEHVTQAQQAKEDQEEEDEEKEEEDL